MSLAPRSEVVAGSMRVARPGAELLLVLGVSLGQSAVRPAYSALGAANGSQLPPLASAIVRFADH